MESDRVADMLRASVDPDGILEELRRLVISYQYASTDDRIAVWSVLNKYAPKVDRLR